MLAAFSLFPVCWDFPDSRWYLGNRLFKDFSSTKLQTVQVLNPCKMLFILLRVAPQLSYSTPLFFLSLSLSSIRRYYLGLASEEMESNYSLFTFLMQLIILKTSITFLHLAKSSKLKNLIHHPETVPYLPSHLSCSIIIYVFNFQSITSKWDGQEGLEQHTAYRAQDHFRF